ncbi:MAG: plasmid mobilization relaxosome protein MobC [Neptuniibacter sp.]
MDRRSYQKLKKLERKQTHKRVELQLTHNEYSQFEKIARREGVSVNAIIKNMAVAYRDTKYFIPSQVQDSLNTLTYLIRNIANNLNQLSHSANIFQGIDRNRIFEHLAQMDEAIQEFVNGKLK